MHSIRTNILNQPTLLPIAGNHDRKPRSLDREVTTVGRARGNDLCLEAKEISTLHCVIYRTPDGYRIRDCNSRCGTRVNGEPVKTGMLHDADIINLGPFSFEFRLPPALFPDAVRPDPLKVKHWVDSRRRLALRALEMRKRLRGGTPHEKEWAQKAHLLKEKIRSYDQRLGELEAAEEELTGERDALARETEKHRQHVEAVAQQLTRQLAKADQEVHQRWQEFQKRCQAEEAGIHASRPAGGEAPTDPQERGRLQDLEQQTQRRHEQLQRDQQEFTTMKEQWAQDQNQASAALAQSKAELVRMMGDLKKKQEELRKQARPDVRALQDDVNRLSRENAELRETRAENENLRALLQKHDDSTAIGGNDVASQLDDLRAEVDLLHEELANKEKILADLQPGAGGVKLQAENDQLKKQLDEQSRRVEELTKKPLAPKTENDLERYETELNDLRRQLETDRKKLNNEVEILRDRNKELDEAIREMEMEMSKERAELARERIRLERVRDEVKADAERLQRELAVRDSMAPVQKLRDELLQKQGPPGKSDKPLNDRLRGMRNHLSDGQPSGS